MFLIDFSFLLLYNISEVRRISSMKTKSKVTILVVIFVVWLVLILRIFSCAIQAEATYNSEIQRDKFEAPKVEEEIPLTAEDILKATEEYQNQKAEEYENRSLTTLPEVEYSGKTYYKDSDATTIAKLMYGECRGIPSRAEKEAVVWVVLNRVDNSRFPNNVYDVVTAKGQFEGYDVNHPVWAELYEIAESVLKQWNAEKNGESINRSLPDDYFFFHGDGVHNWFRKEFSDKTYYQF